jgi:hypothetical protein
VAHIRVTSLPDAEGHLSVTLTAHGIVGGAIVSLMPAHPILGLCLAFASHYLLDAIPHWDYPIRSASVDPKIGARMRYDRALLADAIAIGTDGILGVALPVVLFATRESFVLIACGACAAMLPDFLQFWHARFPHEPLASLQRLHQWAHTSRNLTKQPVLGIASQVALVAAFVMAVRVTATSA